MIAFIDDHRGSAGVAPICRELRIAPSTCHARKAEAREPQRRSAQAGRDADPCEEIARVWRENREVYGARKVWRQLRREGVEVALCAVERPMKRPGLAGAVRGKPVKSTLSTKVAPSGIRDDVSRPWIMAETMGGADREAPRRHACDGGPGLPDRCRAPPHVARRNAIPPRRCAGGSLTGRTTRRLPGRGPWRSPRDAVPVMPWL